ncbi:MAG: hypothetical protein ACKPKO_11790, partial [Candidatus Fonsibacter sp.]
NLFAELVAELVADLVAELVAELVKPKRVRQTKEANEDKMKPPSKAVNQQTVEEVLDLEEQTAKNNEST